MNIAVVHPELRKGGSEATALWIIQTLKESCNVTLISMGNYNIADLNVAYDTDINVNEIKTICLPVPILLRKKFDALRSVPLSRFIRKHMNEYDLLISTYNVMNFGKRGIQFIADFSFDDDLRRSFDSPPSGLRGLLYRKSPLRSLYLMTAKFLSGNYSDGWKSNLTVVNSNWSARIMKERYGIDALTIYPPVPGKYTDIPWNHREDGFVSIGRIVPEKGLDRMVEIIRRVREKGYKIHFHIIGRIDESNPYCRRIVNLARRYNDWLFLEGETYGREKYLFLEKHKYGLHGRKSEPFGIAVAEMIKSGCITFVPDDGGQVEIVNHNDLVYNNTEDAVGKIIRVLKNQQIQRDLLNHLKIQASVFSTERFMSDVRNLIKDFLSGNV